MKAEDDAAGRASRLQTRRRVTSALRIAAALAIVFALAQAVGFSDVLARLADCPPHLAIAAFALTIGMHAVAAYRLRLLANSQGFPLPVSEALLINLASAFYGLFVPGGSATGWTVRLVRLTRGSGRLGSALQLMAGDRALATASGAVIGVIASVFVAAGAATWIAALLVALALVATMLCLVLFVGAAVARPLSWARRVPVVDRALARLEERGTLLRRPDPGTVLTAAGLSFAAHALGVLAWLVLARALDVPLDPVAVAWVRSAAVAATLLPVTVGGLGVREGAVVYLAGVGGIAASDALAWSLLVFATTVFAVGILGGLLEAYFVSQGNRPAR